MKQNSATLALKSAADCMERVISSLFFPFIVAAVTLLCYYLALDMVIIWFMALVGSFIFLYCRDTSPLLAIFLFMNIMISMKNSPTLIGGHPSDYYFRTASLVQIGLCVAVFALSGILRAVREARRGNLKLSPVFWGLCVFAASLLCNSLFSDTYSPMNTLFGFFLAFLFFGVYVFCASSVKVGQKTYDRVALSFIAMAVCMAIELAVAYATYEGLWTDDGGLDRVQLYFGWGMYNTMGMLIVISMPSVAYFAIKYGQWKRSCLFTVLLAALMGITLATLSRQSMMFGAVVFVVCAVWIFVKNPHKWLNGGIYAAIIAVGIVFAIIKRDLVADVLHGLLNNFFDGSGRIDLYYTAFDEFLSNPVFGTGFYRPEKDEFIGLDLIPHMYHCTFFQLIGSGGLFALVAYVVHRVQTVVSYLRRPTHGRSFIALTILALLLLSLLDNHIFYLLPTLVYSSLTAILVKGEEGECDDQN